MPAQSKSRRLAANACWAACVRMADQRERREASTALRRMLGTALAFVWAKRRRKVVASGLHRPPVSRARTTSLHLLERRSSGYVRSLDLRASWRAAPAYWPARLLGWLDEVKGDTKVVSTASCAPHHHTQLLDENAVRVIRLLPRSGGNSTGNVLQDLGGASIPLSCSFTTGIVGEMLLLVGALAGTIWAVCRPTKPNMPGLH